ncbi:MAG: arginine deiminase family protein [Pseudomonadota bacterium]
MPEAPINQKQRKWLDDASLIPDRHRLIKEFAHFQKALEKHDVEVIKPEPVDGVPDQLTPRDIGVVIGDVFVRMRMATSCRANEWRGIQRVIDSIPHEHYEIVPESAVLEGGDVVVDNGFIFVGTGERSNAAGVEFLQHRFGDTFQVVQVPLRGEAQGEDVLHLDCAFVPIGKGKALIYPDGLKRIPDAIRDHYEWIEVNKAEQRILATNVLSIDTTTLISRSAATRVNAVLREHGFEVIEVVFADTPKSGGSFRCASLPLLRDKPS